MKNIFLEEKSMIIDVGVSKPGSLESSKVLKFAGCSHCIEKARIYQFLIVLASLGLLLLKAVKSNML